MFCFRRKKSAKPKAKAEVSSSYVQPSKNDIDSAGAGASTNHSSGRRFHNVENSQYVLPNDDTGKSPCPEILFLAHRPDLSNIRITQRQIAYIISTGLYAVYKEGN
jgi:hypothetical protein